MSIIADNNSQEQGDNVMTTRFKIAAAAAALFILAAPAAKADSKLDEVLARGHLVLGTGSTNAPWHFKSADDKLQGFDIDMGRIIAKALFGDPDKIEYVTQSSDARIPTITTGKVDVTCQFMTVTGERAQQVAFTIPYYREGVGLMMKADSQYADYAALKAAGSSVTVSVLQNVYAEDMVHAALPGATVEEVDSGCCGMAGSFGYEKEHYDLSIAVGNRRLFPAVMAKGPEWEIVASGVSCRQQIPHATGRQARHLVEVLADALPEPE